MPSNLQLIANSSNNFTEAEWQYATTDMELLAVMYSVGYFRHLICTQEVTIITNHKPFIAIF